MIVFTLTILALPEKSNLTQILAPLSSLTNKHIVLSIFLKLQVCLIFKGCVTKNATEKVEWCKWLLTCLSFHLTFRYCFEILFMYNFQILSKYYVSSNDFFDIRHVCVLGGKKCSLFVKFGVLCFLETPILRFAPFAYHRVSIHSKRVCDMIKSIILYLTD